MTAAALVTLRIYVMGLAMISSSPDGKELAILLPKSPSTGPMHHFPVLIYPCADISCAGDAAGVKDDLKLNALNLCNGLLTFGDQTFGAARLNKAAITFNPTPSGNGTFPVRQQRHSGMSGWWFHWHGEVPSAMDSTDTFWMPSLSEIASCATGVTPARAPELLDSGLLVAYLRLTKGQWKSVQTFSLASMKESVAGDVCDPAGGEVTDYAPTIDHQAGFSPFVEPNQAVADIVVIEADIPSGSLMIAPLATAVQVPANGIDLLIGNLTALIGHIPPCDESNLDHVSLFYPLFTNCPAHVPHVGWRSTRVAKSVLGQTIATMRPIINVVSEKNDPGDAGGSARPLCYIPTN